MREIKFRAYDKTAKEMYQVDRLGIGKNSWQQYAEGDKQPKTGKNKFYPSQVEIMQYTGLKDKNGVEIYEGDLVKHLWDDKPYIVQYKEDRCGFSPFANDGGCGCCCDNDFTGFDEIEVVGNIYEVENEIQN